MPRNGVFLELLYRNQSYYNLCMNKLLIGAIVFIAVIIGGYFLFNSRPVEKVEQPIVSNYKNVSYVINGQTIQLQDGVAITEAAPGSASKITTRFFGNELKTDLNGDGREDVAFILTQDGGGSGTFYYAVAALNTPGGYIGSDGYLLGDRIAPQTTNVSPDPSHKYVVVFNYAVRASGEPMTAQPSIGKSTYLKLNPDTMQWAIVLSPEERQSL